MKGAWERGMARGGHVTGGRCMTERPGRGGGALTTIHSPPLRHGLLPQMSSPNSQRFPTNPVNKKIKGYHYHSKKKKKGYHYN